MGGVKSAFSTILGWCCFGFILWLAYWDADQYGYIAHTVEATITVDQNWLAGETKECSSQVLDSKSAEYLGKEPGYVASFFHCDDGPGHTIKVVFNGTEIQPDYTVTFWRCTREPDDFTCLQTGGR
jgi:hypothetical protein